MLGELGIALDLTALKQSHQLVIELQGMIANPVENKALESLGILHRIAWFNTCHNRVVARGKAHMRTTMLLAVGFDRPVLRQAVHKFIFAMKMIEHECHHPATYIRKRQ